jgi:hypothetical protein
MNSILVRRVDDVSNDESNQISNADINASFLKVSTVETSLIDGVYN